MPTSIGWKLFLAFALVASVGVIIVAVVANRSTSQEFSALRRAQESSYAQQAQVSLVTYFQQEGDWIGVESLLAGLARGQRDRLVVVDSDGIVVGDSAGQWVGRDSTELGLQSPLPITDDGQTVGTLYWDPSGGSGMMQGRGPMATPGQGEAQSQSEAEDQFLDRVNRSLWIAVGAALGLGAILSLLFSRQILRPLRALRDAARRIAAADLSQRVPHTSSDEVGEVADAFNAMAEELACAQAQRRQMIADIAHELRTPIAVIDGTVSGILDEVLPPSTENLGSLKEETALLMRLVTDLRDLSLAEAGELKLELSDTDVGQLVEGAVAQMSPLAQAKEVALRAEVGVDLPTVRGDRARLRQVIGNLLDNALRHTPSGGTVAVSAGLAGGAVVVSVVDSGEGIAETDLPRVFERFYRVDKSRSRARGGSGLGLAIVKELVEAHGGRVWAESTVGQGSVFSFTLPAGAARSSGSGKKRASAE